MCQTDEECRKVRAIFRASSIQQRHSVLEDYGRTAGFTFFPSDLHGPFPDTATRMQLYRQHALPLSLEAIVGLGQQALHSITHLITVSCTGMYAPGLEIDLVRALGLPASTQRMSINFMGCYAAITAIRMAEAICKATTPAKVLVVCTELCSIHFQKEPTEDNLLANALFADGSAAALVENMPQPYALRIEQFNSLLIPDPNQNMAWTIGNLGFEMRLSSYIPELLKQGLQSMLHGKSFDGHHLAIHPGGKKILDTLEVELNLNPKALSASRHVLAQFGNMSSPTIIFVLQKIWAEIKASNEKITCMAFGPGLTVEMMEIKTT